MKNFGILLILCSFLSTSLLSTPLLAGSVASRSLSSARTESYNSRSLYNPALLGFNQTPYQVSLESLTEKILATGNSREVTNVDLTFKDENLFYSLRLYSYETPAINYFDEGNTLSFGWAAETVSVAMYRAFIRQNDLTEATSQGFGLSWTLDGKVFIGLYREKGPAKQMQRFIGLAYRVENHYRLEYSAGVIVYPIGTEVRMLSYELEYQWDRLVFGISRDHSFNPTQDNWSSKYYLGWEPEEEGFSIALGLFQTTSASLEKNGSYFNMGYSF